MRTAALVAALLGSVASAATMAAERDLTLPGRPAPLAGTLTLPEGGGRVPGVLIIAGSGPTDRNGNQPGMMNDAYRKLADGFAACGIASLRVDKRGIGLSAAAGPDESDLTLDTFVQDVLRWLDRLRGEPRITEVSVLGHSEGALIGTLVAKRTELARLVLLAGAGRRATTVLREQLSRIGMSPALQRRAEQTIRLLERGETDDDPPVGLAGLFRPGVQPYLISWFRLDPVAELAGSQVPALVVQGTTDLQVGVGDARNLAGARAGVRLEIIPGMNHILRAAPADPPANFATYTDTARPLMPGLLPMLCRFLRP